PRKSALSLAIRSIPIGDQLNESPILFVLSHRNQSLQSLSTPLSTITFLGHAGRIGLWPAFTHRPQSMGSQPSGASSNDENSKAGTTMQLTSGPGGATTRNSSGSPAWNIQISVASVTRCQRDRSPAV